MSIIVCTRNGMRTLAECLASLEKVDYPDYEAIVVDDGDFPESVRPLTVRERFERSLYMLHRHNITAVWSHGRQVK